MIATIVMNWSWQEIPVSYGTEIEKLAWRYTPNDDITDAYGAIFNSIALTASEDNSGPILISDYLEANQTTTGNVIDYIELQPSGELVLPWHDRISALNKPMVMWQNWDILKIVAR